MDLDTFCLFHFHFIISTTEWEHFSGEYIEYKCCIPTIYHFTIEMAHILYNEKKRKKSGVDLPRSYFFWWFDGQIYTASYRSNSFKFKHAWKKNDREKRGNEMWVVGELACQRA